MIERTGVIFNDRVLLRPLTGIGNYARSLLQALSAEQDTLQVCAFLSSLVGRRLERLRQAASDGGMLARSTRRWGRALYWLRSPVLQAYAAGFRWAARRCALYHEPNHIPIRCDCPTVTTIHDLSVLVHPEWHPADRVRWYEREFAGGLAQTQRFLAVSEFTRQEMVRRLNIRPQHIDVTPLAARPTFRPQPAERVAACRLRFALPERFFLFVGTLEPRKNVAGLLNAYAGLPLSVRRAHALVLVGGWGWKTADLAELLRKRVAADDVRLVGHVDDDVLACLYSAATALVWPTFYEGFGLPPLEALACGCPVIASNVASLPEVVGEGGVLLDPHDSSAWTTAMRQMAEDAEWRAEWQRRGPIQAAKFSWSRCAAETRAAYERVVPGVLRVEQGGPAR